MHLVHCGRISTVSLPDAGLRCGCRSPDSATWALLLLSLMLGVAEVVQSAAAGWAGCGPRGCAARQETPGLLVQQVARSHGLCRSC